MRDPRADDHRRRADIPSHFMDIMRAIYERDMFVFDFNINGFFLTQEVLDEFKKLGCNPLMKISFDGIGYHDWMRGAKESEEDALRAICLCVDNGFRVMVQSNINKTNLPTLEETLNLLDYMRVARIRLIRTTPAPRWEQNAAGQTFSIKEYYDLALETAKNYAAKEHRAELVIWQVTYLYPESKMFALVPVKNTDDKFRSSIPICRTARGMVAIGANGEIYPCMQMSGGLEDRNQANSVKEKSVFFKEKT